MFRRSSELERDVSGLGLMQTATPVHAEDAKAEPQYRDDQTGTSGEYLEEEVLAMKGGRQDNSGCTDGRETQVFPHFSQKTCGVADTAAIRCMSGPSRPAGRTEAGLTKEAVWHDEPAESRVREEDMQRVNRRSL